MNKGVAILEGGPAPPPPHGQGPAPGGGLGFRLSFVMKGSLKMGE